jgi:hypothetical protein
VSSVTAPASGVLSRMLSVLGINGATASGNPFGAVVTVVVAPA